MIQFNTAKNSCFGDRSSLGVKPEEQSAADSQESPAPSSPSHLRMAVEPPSEAGTAEPVFYTVAEVARLCRVSERTVRRWIKAGTLRKVPLAGRLVRISSAELRRLAASGWFGAAGHD